MSYQLKIYRKSCDSNAEIKSQAAQWTRPDLILYVDESELLKMLEWAADQLYQTVSVSHV